MELTVIFYLVFIPIVCFSWCDVMPRCSVAKIVAIVAAANQMLPSGVGSTSGEIAVMKPDICG